MAHLTELPYAFLFEHLHSVVFACFLVQNEENFAIGSFPEQDEGSEITHSRLVSVGSSPRLHFVDDVLI